MTTPRDPDRSIRGGETPRGGEPQRGGQPPWAGEDRWTPEDRYVVERHEPAHREPAGRAVRDDYDRWEPQARRRRPLWASAGLALLLALVLVGLILAAVVVPGLMGSASSPSPSPSAQPTVVAETASPSPTPTPTRSPSATPLPSVLQVVVKSGDSLTSIAAEYDTKARSIAFWNRDRYPSLDPQSEAYEPDQIQVGWTLVVYPGEVFPEPSPGIGASGDPAGSPSASAGG